MADSKRSSLGSISVSVSKGSVYESGGLSMYDAALEDALGREERSLSNEEIRKGDTLLDTYTVEADAISGGMGSVWRVHHQSWNTDLAMKRPQPRFFAEGSKRRKENFIKECEAWINLGLHPNIVSCYYVREIGGVPTIFSEWMNNGSLKDRIRDSSLYEGTKAEQTERLLDLTIQSARGLRYSHENGLIHRDVKPDNLLLTKEWDAKVVDFGLAKARDEALSEEGAEHKGGYTPEYCSSEQAAGLDTDARTDIYSWALSVLEMYTKGRVWESGPEVSENREAFLDATKLPLPAKLRALLHRCLEADVDKRHCDFAEIEAMLHEIYKEETGDDYPREASKAAADTADSLNNRALSYLDLGKPEEAEKLWERALRNDYSNFRCHFNHAVCLWNQRKIDDIEFHARILEQRESTALWAKAMATVSLIRRNDDREATECVELLASLDADSPALPELQRLLEHQNSIDPQCVNESNQSAIHLVSPPEQMTTLVNQTTMQSVKAKRSPDECFYMTEDGACLDAKTRQELWRFPDYVQYHDNDISHGSNAFINYQNRYKHYISYGSFAVIYHQNRYTIIECATGKTRFQIDGDDSSNIYFNRDGRKAVYRLKERKGYCVIDLTLDTSTLFLFNDFYVGDTSFANASGSIVACMGEAVRFFDATNGRSLLTIEPERDIEDDVIYDDVVAFSDDGLAHIKSNKRQFWIKLPVISIQPKYELSMVSSHRERSGALAQAERNYNCSMARFDEGDLIGAFRMLDQNRINSTLQQHEPSLRLWTKLSPFFKRGKLILVLPTNDAPEPLPARSEATALTNPERRLYATEGSNILHVHFKEKMTWAQDTYWDLDYSYSLSVYNSVSDELYFEISNLTTDFGTDKEPFDVELHVELEQNGTLHYGKNTWEKTAIIDLCDPQIQIDRGLSIALPGGYRLCNRKDGVDIGGFRFSDVFNGLQPLWNADIIVCRNHNYRLVYQYIDPERE